MVEKGSKGKGGGRLRGHRRSVSGERTVVPSDAVDGEVGSDDAVGAQSLDIQKHDAPFACRDGKAVVPQGEVKGGKVRQVRH